MRIHSLQPPERFCLGYGPKTLGGCAQCMTAGAKTCFLEVTSVRLGQALQRSLTDLPPGWAEKGAVWCDDYDFRVGACARTWLRPHAQDNLMCAASRLQEL